MCINQLRKGPVRVGIVGYTVSQKMSITYILLSISVKQLILIIFETQNLE